ncbi:MAG: hypothetical protein GX327_02285 [Epulopiscium sp.]|jgi:hypothetical protein|nr:hypothetical protein [Candidatus Epulonipiscium sp.]
MLSRKFLGGVLFAIIILTTVFLAICYYMFFANQKQPSRGQYVQNIIDIDYGGKGYDCLYKAI